MPTGVSPSANTSLITGMTRCVGSRASNCARVVESFIVWTSQGRLERVDIEAAARPSVAGGPHLVDAHEDRVSVAVEGGTTDELHVARSVALAPVLLA